MGKRGKRAISVSPDGITAGTPDKRPNYGRNIMADLSASFINQPLSTAMNISTPIAGYVQPSPSPTPAQSPYGHSISPAQNQYYVPAQQPAFGFGLQDATGGNMQGFMQSVKCMFDTIDTKLRNLDSKLRVLDNIDKQVTEMNSKIATMDRRVTSLERQLNESNRQITELETSRAFDSQTCDDLKRAQSDISRQVTELDNHKKDLTDSLKSVTQENIRLNEQLLDLQSRSMRDNLLFHNIDECSTREERLNENCVEKIQSFFETKLNITDARDVKIDRAHRIGPFRANKTRPVVVKFNFFQDKLRVKQAANDKLKNTDYRVSEQYPKTIQDRRKTLYPAFAQARRDGKRAYLSYDKLYIDGTMYTADNLPPGAASGGAVV